MFGDVPSSMPVQSIAQGVSDCKHFPPCGGIRLISPCLKAGALRRLGSSKSSKSSKYRVLLGLASFGGAVRGGGARWPVGLYLPQLETPFFSIT